MSGKFEEIPLDDILVDLDIEDEDEGEDTQPQPEPEPEPEPEPGSTPSVNPEGGQTGTNQIQPGMTSKKYTQMKTKRHSKRFTKKIKKETPGCTLK